MFLLINTSYSPYSLSVLHATGHIDSCFIEQSSSLINSLCIKLDDLVQGQDHLRQLESLVFVSGPASYTGTRIGASLVEAILTKVPSIPVINVTLFDLICYQIKPTEKSSVAIKGFGQYYYGATCQWLDSRSIINDLCLVKKEALAQFGTLADLPSSQEQITLAFQYAKDHCMRQEKCADQAEPCYITTKRFLESEG